MVQAMISSQFRSGIAPRLCQRSAREIPRNSRARNQNETTIAAKPIVGQMNRFHPADARANRATLPRPVLQPLMRYLNAVRPEVQ